MKSAILILAGFSGLILTACGASETGPPKYDFSAADRVVESFLADTPSLEGAGMIVVHRDWGVVHHRAFGGFALDRISPVASASKMVSAGILNRLADDGILDLKAPLRDFLGWEGAYPDVNTAQLISNSSGLVGLLPDPAFGPYVCQWLSEERLRECGESILTSMEAAADVLAPNTEFRYGGGQWQVAGAVAEAVSGKSWSRLFEEIYVEPCGLKSSRFHNPFADVPRSGVLAYPAGFSAVADPAARTANPNIEAGLYTTTGDYGQLLLMQLREGRCGKNFVMSADSVKRMQANQIRNVWGGTTNLLWSGYGYGWWVDTTKDGWITDPGAFGAVPWLDLPRGYGAMIIIEADSSLGVALAGAILASIEMAIDNPG